MKIFPLNIDGAVADAVRGYTGRWVKSVEIALDREMPGVYGIRAMIGVRRLQTVDFLIKATPLATVTAEDLKDAKFIMWPPRSL